MVVALTDLSLGHGGFGQRLVLHGGVGAIEQAADGGAVFGDEGYLSGELIYGHNEVERECTGVWWCVSHLYFFDGYESCSH